MSLFLFTPLPLVAFLLWVSMFWETFWRVEKPYRIFILLVGCFVILCLAGTVTVLNSRFAYSADRARGSQVMAMRRLAPEKLPQQVDPFASAPLKTIAGRYYSIGPDRVDNKLSIIYDPTNGSWSSGDIFAGPGPEPKTLSPAEN
jgi:hypothetical protein